MTVDIAHGDCLGACLQNTVGNHHIFTGLLPVGDCSQGNTVVPAFDIAVGDNNPFTAADMQAVVIGDVQIGSDSQAMYFNILAFAEGDGPAGGISDGDTLQSNMLHVMEKTDWLGLSSKL